MRPLIFKSRIDAWFVLVLVAADVAVVVSLVAARQTPALWPVHLVTIALGIGLPLWLLISTRYEIGDTDLHIVSGPVRARIPLRDITGVEPTRSVLASPALSLDRLRISYGTYGSVMISPKDKDGFVRELTARVDSVAGPRRW